MVIVILNDVWFDLFRLAASITANPDQATVPGGIIFADPVFGLVLAAAVGIAKVVFVSLVAVALDDLLGIARGAFNFNRFVTPVIFAS